MRDVGIIARVFHDPGGRTAVKSFENGNREADARAIRKLHFDRVRTFSGYERLIRGPCSSRRTSTRGPATLQRLTRSFLIRIFGVAHILFQSGAPKPIMIFS